MFHGLSQLFIALVFLISYVISSCIFYNMYKQANLKNPWVAFIPVFGQIKVFNLANLSMWFFVLLVVVSFIPVVGTILLYIAQAYLSYTLGKNFGMKDGYCIVGIFIPIILYLAIIIQKRGLVRQINPKYLNTSYSETNY